MCKELPSLTGAQASSRNNQEMSWYAILCPFLQDAWLGSYFAIFHEL